MRCDSPFSSRRSTDRETPTRLASSKPESPRASRSSSKRNRRTFTRGMATSYVPLTERATPERLSLGVLVLRWCGYGGGA